jgi:magnesium chelatase family protein
MAFATVHAIALLGLQARDVRVECHAANGLPGTRITGLPDTVVRESAERVKSAVQRSGLKWHDARTLVNLAPAGLPKTGTGFDLAIAIAALGSVEEVEASALEGVWAFGELGLDGDTHAVPGALPVAKAVRDLGGRRLFISERSAAEAALIEGIEVVPIEDLREARAILAGEQPPRPVTAAPTVVEDAGPDLREVRGQATGRRAIEIAAAGAHHLLFAGPPGCGKSMLAARLPSVLPPLSLTEALEVASIHSIAGTRDPDAPLTRRPPYRDPHHGTSAVGLIGGGTGIATPGELSLAHKGILFIDELLEVPRGVSDHLRQPLENGYVTITRTKATVRFPAEVLLVAATNPCPCGHLGSSKRACRCRPDEVQRYRNRLSGPLLDRIDLQVELGPVEESRLTGPPDGEESRVVAERVAGARAIARDRWGANALNRRAPSSRLRETAAPGALRALAAAIEAMGLSARAFDRSLRVARTIADLAGRDTIGTDDVEEAVAYRLRDLTSVR